MMAGVYAGKERAYVFLYSPHPDVMIALPPLIRNGSEHIAQASYRTTSEKGISIYTLPLSAIKDLSPLRTDFRRFPREMMDKFQREIIFNQHSIKARINHADLDTINLILELLAIDVNNFAAGITPKYRSGTRVEMVPELIPSATQKFCGEVKINDSGKQDYVPSCLIDLSIDFFRGSCITQLTPQGYYSPYSRCNYCYASGTQNDIPTLRLLSADKSDLVEQIRSFQAKRDQKGKSTRYLRFGKVSEAGSKLTREQLLTTLEACVEANLKPIFPTKFLEYDPKVAELIKKTDGSILYSIGTDELELGAVESGCNNQFRFEQAQEYHHHGIKTALYLLVEAGNSPGSPFSNNLELAIKLHDSRGIPIQLLPLRPLGRKQLTLVTGTIADDLLRGDQGILPFGNDHSESATKKFTPGGYFRGNNNQCIPDRIHPDILKLLTQPDYSMCHHTPETTWCGGCLHRDPQITETEEVKIERFSRRKRSKPALGQTKLF